MMTTSAENWMEFDEIDFSGGLRPDEATVARVLRELVKNQRQG